MSFIEGIGDEVVLFFIVVFVFALAALITLVGSVPPAGTTALGRYEYENNASVQRENAEVTLAANEAPSHHHQLPTVTFLQARIIEDTPHDIEIIRTEADGSSIEDTTENLRTEADGSAEHAANHPSEETTVPSLDVPEETSRIGEIRVRLKYLNDTERIVTTNLCTKIGDFKKNHFRDSIRENKIVRLIFAGHLLQDNATVENCRILDNSVVHVQVLPAQTVQSNQPTSQDSDLDVGRLLMPAITVILGMCWVLYSKYPEFFSTLSLGVLGTLSCFFFVYVVQSRR